MRDVKGIAVFLLVSFGLLAVSLSALWAAGWLELRTPTWPQQFALCALMFIPGLGALAARRVSTESAIDGGVIWPVPSGPALRIVIAVPIVYLVIYLIPALIGWSSPQWGMGGLFNELGVKEKMDPAAAAVAPPFMLIAGMLLSMVLGGTIVAGVALGSEYGWRGFLLPRLMPLGRYPAHLIAGALSGLWFAPFTVIWMSQADVLDRMWPMAIRAVLLGMALGLVLGEIWRRTGHLGLCAIFLGSFISHNDGMWQYLFPMHYKYWTGTTGVVSVTVWFVVGLLPFLLTKSPRTTQPAARVQGEPHPAES